jgi:cell division protein FtsB
MGATLGAIWLTLRRAQWPALLALGVALYFVYHAIDGRRGALAWREVGEQLDEARAQLASLREQRREIELKVRRLRHDSLDPDLIDELARRRLSFVAPLDVIILLDDDPPVR